jgi:hypothetical protein
MIIAHTFYYDTIVDESWRILYYEPEKYETLIFYFMKPSFHSFILAEAFINENLNI